MWTWPLERMIRKTIEDAVLTSLVETNKKIGSYAKVEELQRQIATLEIEKSKREEEYARREREVEHKVGLERKRQEFEIEQSKREATVKVQQENLAADKERFKAEMNFQRKHLEGEIGSLRDLVKDMLQRLPSAEIYAEVSGGKSRNR